MTLQDELQDEALKWSNACALGVSDGPFWSDFGPLRELIFEVILGGHAGILNTFIVETPKATEPCKLPAKMALGGSSGDLKNDPK